MDVVRVTWPVFRNFVSITNLVDEAMHIKFRVLFDTEEYQCMHNGLPPKGMCSGSRNLYFRK